MSEESGLFERWGAEEELPEPYQTIVNRRGAKKYSTDPNDCSVHNPVVGGKSASLHPATLRAIGFALELFEGLTVGAAGYQVGADNNVNYYCIEYEKKEGRCALIYNYRNGIFKGMLVKDNITGKLLPVRNGLSSGEEYIALMAYASLQINHELYDEEFAEKFAIIQNELSLQTEMNESTLLHAAFICCDNWYRRIEGGRCVEEGGLPIYRGQFREGIEMIPKYQIQSGICSPNHGIIGEFQILTPSIKPEEKTISELKRVYYKEREMSDASRAKIPELPEGYRVSAGAQEILQMVVKTPARIFMITGNAGVGKTTDCRIIAQILGFPYFKLTCGPGTDETELLASPMPNMGVPEPKTEQFPSLEDFMMDPASALAIISGRYRDGIVQDKAFQEILSTSYQKGYQKAKKEKDYTLVESAIVQACREPSVLEIQEPAMIENSGTLTKLNGLLDDSRCTDLLNGETIVRNPETIIILTTNLNYIGCRMFNESILSRMSLIQHRRDLTAAEMVERVIARINFKERELLTIMADIVVKIQNHLQTEDIQGGVCGYRELENWALKYLVDRNVLRSVNDTVISKAARLPEDREEIMESYVLPYFEVA